ncbi:MAG: MFS transporter [Pseudonocardiaceae bacterium]
MHTKNALIDISSLRGNPAFARLWFGTTVSAMGGQLSSYAVLLQSWDMTHSAAAVGGTGLAIGVPRILFALFGGALSDNADRRRLVLFTGIGLIAGSLALTVQSAAQWNSIWLIYLISAAKAVLSSIAGPARATFIPSLLSTDKVAAGVALNQVSSQWSVFAGPMLAGWLTSWFGLTVCFALDTLSYLASLYGVYRLPALTAASKERPGFSTIADGVRYIVRKPVIVGCLLADLCAMVLAYPSALLPVVNSDHFGGDPTTLAYMISAMALGGFLSSLLSGWATRSDRPGLLLLVAVMMWGGALAMAGLSDDLWMVLALMLVAGAADTIAVLGKGIVIQLSTDNGYLGRVNAASQSIGVAGPALGNFRAGVVGSAVGAEAAIALGGVMSLCGAILVLVLIPSVRMFSRSQAENARAEKLGG